MVVIPPESKIIISSAIELARIAGEILTNRYFPNSGARDYGKEIFWQLKLNKPENYSGMAQVVCDRLGNFPPLPDMDHLDPRLSCIHKIAIGRNMQKGELNLGKDSDNKKKAEVVLQLLNFFTLLPTHVRLYHQQAELEKAISDLATK